MLVTRFLSLPPAGHAAREGTPRGDFARGDVPNDFSKFENVSRGDSNLLILFTSGASEGAQERVPKLTIADGAAPKIARRSALRAKFQVAFDRTVALP